METCSLFSVSKFYYGFRKHSIFIFTICLLCFVPEIAFGQKKAKQEKKERWSKIIICHKGETIEINESALQAHLDHGDYIGPCGAPVYTGEITPHLPQVGKVDEPIGNELTALAELYESTGSAASDEVYMISNGSRVLVEIGINGGEDGKANVKALLQSKYQIYNFIESELNPWVITVLFPIDKLTDLNNDELWSGNRGIVQPVNAPIFNSGAVTSSGDFAQYSDVARNAFDVNGQGIKVCAISDSYNALGLNAASDNIANGDLPEGVEIVMDYNNQDGILSDVKDEGRALLQIVHDVAPEAELAFRTGAYGEQDMVNGIFALRDRGCKIIFDDITYPKEPVFKDGILAQAVNSVVRDGVLFYTTAGNFADNSYSSTFKAASNSPSNHAFDGNNDIYQEVAFSEGFYRLILQWDDIYESLDTAENGAKIDLDIYLLNDAGDTIVNSN